MPCTFKTNRDANLVVKRYSGRITVRCILNLLDTIEVDPNYVYGMRELDDMSEVTALAISPEEVEHIAALIKGYSVRARGLSRKAVVANSDDIRDAAGMFASLLADAGLQVGIFDTLEEAFSFLDVCHTVEREELLPQRILIN